MKTKLCLKVYDLSPLNKSFRWIGIGAFHTSLIIDNKIEVYYGYSDEYQCGIYQADSVGGIPDFLGEMSLYGSYELGPITKSLPDCRKVLNHFMASLKWNCLSYSTFFHNCNSFTYEFCKAICNSQEFLRYPTWILRGEQLFRFIFKISLSQYLIPFTDPNIAYRPRLDQEINENEKETPLLSPGN